MYKITTWDYLKTLFKDYVQLQKYSFQEVFRGYKESLKQRDTKF